MITIVLEINLLNHNDRLIHKIKRAEFDDKGFYISAVSFNAFFFSLKKRNRNQSKNKLYAQKIFEEWYEEQEMVSKNPIIAHLDQRLLPYVEHDGIWDFYKYIGYDYKTKKYN